MITHLTDILRMFGDAPITHCVASSDGRQTEITIVIDHPPRCCDKGCPECQWTGLAVELGVSHAG